MIRRGGIIGIRAVGRLYCRACLSRGNWIRVGRLLISPVIRSRGHRVGQRSHRRRSSISRPFRRRGATELVHRNTSRLRLICCAQPVTCSRLILCAHRVLRLGIDNTRRAVHLGIAHSVSRIRPSLRPSLRSTPNLLECTHTPIPRGRLLLLRLSRPVFASRRSLRGRLRQILLALRWPPVGQLIVPFRGLILECRSVRGSLRRGVAVALIVGVHARVGVVGVAKALIRHGTDATRVRTGSSSGGRRA